MFLKFFLLQWRTVTRSPVWHKNLVLNLVIGFFIFLLCVYLLLLGLFLNRILKEMVPDKDPFEILNGLLIYYFLADLLIRFMMQSLPKLTIESYLHLPIPKRKVINFMLCRTIPDVFNIIPLLVIIPVGFTFTFPESPGNTAMIWVFTLIMFVLGNNFLSTFLKRQLGNKPVYVAVVAMILITAIILDHMHYLELTVISAGTMSFLSSHPGFLVFPFIWMALLYLLQYKFLQRHMFPDEVQVRKSYEAEAYTGPNRYLKSLGLTGTIFSLELKMYWRNKRTRTIIYMLPIFLLYGFFFYPQDIYLKQNGFLIFVGIFMTGGMMINYANYAFGYESSYFDTLLTKNIDFTQYIQVKFLISVMICFVCFILTIPYVLYGYKILLINTAMFLYNIGILSYLLLFFATFNKNRIDMSRGGAFNFQGIGAMNWLAIIPAFLLPILIYIPFKIAGYPNIGVAATGVLGITGLFFSKSIIRLIGKQFNKRKYIMVVSFREK